MLEMHGLDFAITLKTVQFIPITKYFMLYFMHFHRPLKLIFNSCLLIVYIIKKAHEFMKELAHTISAIGENQEEGW